MNEVLCMAVDPKYVEEVRKDGYDDIMEELGLEGHFEQIGNGVDMEGYEITNLRDMYPDDECTGRPVISDIYTTEFKDKDTGETITNSKIDLILFDDTYEEEKEAFVFTCNLKQENIDEEKHIVKNVYNSSGLYALAMGLAELKAKGISKSFTHLDVVGYKKLQKQVKNYSTLTVQVVGKKATIEGEEKYYNSFKIISGEE